MSDAGGEPIAYVDAMRELDEILEQIESDDVDIDLLSARVTRAAELIRTCRERIHATRIEVEEIVAGLESGTDGEEAATT
jgi:exodeoxyribonuclease VII small subunit